MSTITLLGLTATSLIALAAGGVLARRYVFQGC